MLPLYKSPKVPEKIAPKVTFFVDLPLLITWQGQAVKSWTGWYNRAMPKRKRKAGMEDATAIVMGFANLVDALFQRYTGKTMQDLLKESAQRPRELPAGEKPAPVNSDMPLADAYMILGLKPDASLEDVKKHYRNLAWAFHSDKGSVMNDEAMKLLNRAYETITHKER